MNSHDPFPIAPRRGALVLSLVFAVVLLLTAVQILSAEEEGLAPADLGNSDKNVDMAEAEAGQTVRYTITLSNTGTPGLVTITDTFGVDLTYAGNFSQDPDGGVYTYTNGVLVWSGFAGSVPVLLSFDATLTDTLQAGEAVTNTVQIGSGSTVINRSAVTAIVSDTDYIMNFPIIQRSLPQIPVFATRPSSANEWTVFWDEYDDPTVVGYQLQESQSANFSTLTADETFNTTTTSYPVSKPPSSSSAYYYRIRLLGSENNGPWSTPRLVRGAYIDNFDDPSTGWELRRTSFLERTIAYYGTGADAGNYILIVDDRWDWMIASPLMPAPELPYVIEYRARVNDPSNLVSGGVTFAGDWNGGPCLDNGNVYEFTNCFNRFHNLNFIWFGPIKLLYEQIDQLVWCPTCMGSLLKRIGTTAEGGTVIPDELAQGYPYHTYKVEVRDSGVTVFVDGAQKFFYSDTRYLEQPYFGLFASTEEYKPSIWFFDWIKVTPLD